MHRTRRDIVDLDIRSASDQSPADAVFACFSLAAGNWFWFRDELRVRADDTALLKRLSSFEEIARTIASIGRRGSIAR